MSKERVDAIKNRNKIVKEVVQNPLQSQRELAKKTGLGKTTVQEHIKQLPNTTKDDRIIDLTNKDLEIVILAQSIIEEKLLDREQVEKMNVKDVSSVAKDSSARYTLFRGNATDNEGGLIINWDE